MRWEGERGLHEDEQARDREETRRGDAPRAESQTEREGYEKPEARRRKEESPDA
jgi:hypothetical protein